MKELAGILTRNAEKNVVEYDYNELNDFRQRMVDEGGNIGWCRPYQNGNVKFAINCGDIVGLEVDGKDVDFSIENLIKIARLFDSDFDENKSLYRGYTDKEIILSTLLANATEIDCCDCPCFLYCEAMDD